MPWSEVSVMDLRLEFVMLAEQPGANVSALCRRFGISRKTGYKWLSRARSGPMDLSDLSRRPRSSPRRTPKGMEASVLAVRSDHPCWGGRKTPAGRSVPAPAAFHALGQAGTPAAFQRFERSRPNELWQMDFKGHFALAQGRCHPLTVLDDCSRFNLCLAACGNEQGETVQGHLRAAFRRYGLPEWIIVDNGSPWGDGPNTPYTPLGVWLLRLGIGLSHSRPYHPQTLGKDERFHRTLKAELLGGPPFGDLGHCQRAFDRWRIVYNCERPHQALDLDVPAARFRPSASLPRGPAAHRVRARTSGPPRPGQRPHQLQGQDLQTAQVRRIPGRTGANHSGRNMEDLRKPPDRATRHARWHSQNCYPCLRTPVTLVPGPYTPPGSLCYHGNWMTWLY